VQQERQRWLQHEPHLWWEQEVGVRRGRRDEGFAFQPGSTQMRGACGWVRDEQGASSRLGYHLRLGMVEVGRGLLKSGGW